MNKNIKNIALSIFLLALLCVAYQQVEDVYAEKFAIYLSGPEPIMPKDEINKKLAESTDGKTQADKFFDNAPSNMMAETEEKIRGLKMYSLQLEYSARWREQVENETNSIIFKVAATLIVTAGFVAFFLLKSLRTLWLQAFPSNLPKIISLAAKKVLFAKSVAAASINKKKISSYQAEYAQSKDLFAAGLISKEQHDAKHAEIKEKIQSIHVGRIS